MFDIALDYIRRGYRVQPIAHGAKECLDKGWSQRVITAKNAHLFFNGGPQNIAFQFGPAGLTDVDCDCPESLVVAALLLPPTDSAYGRASKPRSHLLYNTDLASTYPNAVEAFQDPTDDAMLIELRCGGGGKGALSIAPGSVHPSGEAVAWASNGTPATVDGAVLRRAVTLTAIACLLARHWPNGGSRHEAALTCGGFFKRAGLSDHEIRTVMQAVAKAAHDREVENRIGSALDNAKYDEKRGLPSMIEAFGEPVAKQTAEWLGFFEKPKGAIELVEGRLPEIVDQCEAALLAGGNPHSIYQYAGNLVHPIIETVDASHGSKTQTYRLNPATTPFLCDKLGRAATFIRFDMRRQEWVAKDCPKNVAETLLSRAGEWRAPQLAGVATAPFMRRDGSICDKAGYDIASNVLYLPGNMTFPPIPSEPTRRDAEQAFCALWRILETFPFVSDPDMGVALSGILTALDRRSLDAAPLHAADAPVAGSGKSLIVDVAAVIATGYPAPALATGRTIEEMNKRIDAALIAGRTLVNFDNVTITLESDAFCQALTQPWYEARVLGLSKVVKVKVGTAFFLHRQQFANCRGHDTSHDKKQNRSAMRATGTPKF